MRLELTVETGEVLELGWSPHGEWEAQVGLEIQVAGLNNGFNTCEGEKGDKEESQVSRTNSEDKNSISNSIFKFLDIFSETTSLGPSYLLENSDRSQDCLNTLPPLTFSILNCISVAAYAYWGICFHTHLSFPKIK